MVKWRTRITPARGQVGDHLLVGGAQGVFPLLAVFKPEHLVAEAFPAAAFLPDLGRAQCGKIDLLGPGLVHLFAHDLHHLQHHLPAQGQVFVDPGGQLADHARPQHQLVADHLGLGRDFL
jgi:hypothetical protein